MHAQPYSEAPANLGRGRGRTSGGKRPVAVQIVRDLLHSRSGSGSGCITDQNYFWIANRVYQSWLLRFSLRKINLHWFVRPTTLLERARGQSGATAPFTAKVE